MAQRTAPRRRASNSYDNDTEILLDKSEIYSSASNDCYDHFQPEKYTVAKCQTIIANHEVKRSFFEEDVWKPSLEKYVAFSIFGNGRKNSRNINLVVESVLRENEKLNPNFKNEILCKVIYIFGTSYDKDGSNIFDVPLFKLYKKTDVCNCLFIDITGKIYKNWKEFIEADDWFHCMLIAPKNGRYKFSSSGEIELQNILKLGKHPSNQNKIIKRNDLYETIDKYFSNEKSEFTESEVDRISFEISQCLLNKIASGSCVNIDHVAKSEVFVDAHIFSKTIEILELNWHVNLMNDLRDVDGKKMEDAKQKAQREIFKIRNDKEFEEKFKHYWIYDKKLFLLYENDWKKVYGFQYSEDIDFERLLGEVSKKKFFEMEIARNNNVFTIKCKNNEKIKFFVNDETDNETEIAYMIVPKSIIEKQPDLSWPGNMNQKNNNVDFNNSEAGELLPFNPSVRDFMQQAREFQILIATWCEGQFNHRCLEKFDEEILQRFVGNAIFGDKNRMPTPENNNTGFDKEELDKINLIVNLIKRKNKDFAKHRKDNEKNQIHYGVVQIVGYEYADKKNSFYKTPLFKVFKNKDDDNPILIDECGHVFESWEHFYDASYLPESLICTPKNGYYNLTAENNLELDFVNTTAYWAKKGRKMRLALHIAICAGSLFLAFYTGPIAYEIGLGLATRVGFGALAIGNGVSAAKICLRKQVPVTRADEYAQSLQVVLSACADILAPAAEASLCAWLGLGVVTAGGLGLGAYVIYTIGKRSYLTYKQTGELDWKDALTFANALLMCGNFSVKLTVASCAILKSEKLQKFPLLKNLLSEINPFSSSLNNLSAIVNVPFNNNYGNLTPLFCDIRKSALQFASDENVKKFQEDCERFGNRLVQELLSMSWPILREYARKKFNIDLGTNCQNIFRCGVSYFDIFKIKKWLDEKDILNTIKKKILGRIINKKNVFEGINAVVSRITKLLLKKTSMGKDTNIDKFMKAEVFVEKEILNNISNKLQVSHNAQQFEAINPNLLKRAYEETVQEIEDELDDRDFIEKFRSYLNTDEDLILLTNENSCDFYVFQNQSVNTVVREINNSYYKMKKRENCYIIDYYNSKQKLILHFDDKDRNNIIGYVVAENRVAGKRSTRKKVDNDFRPFSFDLFPLRPFPEF